MRFAARCGYLLLLAGACLTGCGNAAPSTSPSGLSTVNMSIGSGAYTLEVADTEAAREHGLMERDSLPADHGMIFVFDDDAERKFWMYHTRFPLDILYLSNLGKIVSIHHMKAFDESAVASDGPARFAVELNQGEADKDAVHAGDTLSLPKLPTTRPAR